MAFQGRSHGSAIGPVHSKLTTWSLNRRAELNSDRKWIQHAESGDEEQGDETETDRHERKLMNQSGPDPTSENRGWHNGQRDSDRLGRRE